MSTAHEKSAAEYAQAQGGVFFSSRVDFVVAALAHFAPLPAACRENFVYEGLYGSMTAGNALVMGLVLMRYTAFGRRLTWHPYGMWPRAPMRPPAASHTLSAAHHGFVRRAVLDPGRERCDRVPAESVRRSQAQH